MTTPEYDSVVGRRRLGSGEQVLARALERSVADERDPIARTVEAASAADGGGRSLAQVAAATALPLDDVAFAPRRLLEMKLITLSEVLS